MHNQHLICLFFPRFPSFLPSSTNMSSYINNEIGYFSVSSKTIITKPIHTSVFYHPQKTTLESSRSRLEETNVESIIS